MILIIFQVFFKVLSLASTRLTGKLSFNLSYYPRARSKLRHHEQKTMAEAKRKQIEINGKNIVTYSWGEGKPILLVHGHESRASRYTLLVDKLLKHGGYNLISFDAPGHGDSEGKSTDILEYQKIITELEKNYGGFFCIVSHSVGVLCSFYAIKNGVKTEKIIAISGVCQLSYITKKIATTLKLSEAILQDLNRRLELLFSSTNDIWSKFSADDKDVLIKSKLLIIHDHDDDVVDFEQSERLHLCHRSTVPIIRTYGLGHRRILSDPDIINSVVEFIQK